MGDFAVVDVELLEERVVEVAADLAVAVLVKRVGVGDEVQGVAQHSCSKRKLFRCRRESGFDTGSVKLDLVEFGSDLRGGQCAVGGEVDESRFFFVEIVDAPGQCSMCFALAALSIRQRCVELVATFVREVLAELEGDVVIDDRLLYSLNGDVRQVAESVLSCATEEVAVATAAAFGLGVDQS